MSDARDGSSGREETTTLYLRNVPRSIALEAKAQAAKRDVTLAQHVSESLARYAVETGGDGRHPYPDAPPPFADDMAWFRTHREELQEKFPGEYLAIIGQRVVDHDSDFAALAPRIFSEHGSGPVYMPRVEGDAPVWRIRSPRARE